MIVTLIGKNNIYKTDLPEEVNGNFWISEKTKEADIRILNIQANNGKWQIESNNYAKIIHPEHVRVENDCLVASQEEGSIIAKGSLEENNMYAISLGDSREIYILYCASDKENEFDHKDIINTQTIKIGSGNSNSIIYKNAFVSEKHTEIVKRNGRWIIENFDTRYGTFVNNVPIANNRKVLLANGDIIFIMGLKLIIIKDSIYINNPQNSVKLNENYFVPSKIKNVPVNKKDIDKEKQEIVYNKKEEYFNRAPRLLNLIEREKVSIDEPPTANKDQQKPIILMLGSSLAMGVMAILSLSTAIQGLVRGTAEALETVIAFITAFLMIVAMVIIPLLDVKYDKKMKDRDEKKRQQKYKEYLNKKQVKINQIREKQRKKLYENYLNAKECINIIMQNGHRLWERKIEEEDFLLIRLGIGTVPLNIEISGPQDRFAIEDDNLLDAYNDLIENSINIANAPVTVSLLKNNVMAVINKNASTTEKFVKNIILQLVTFHSYEDLKLVFLVNDCEKWKYVKMLPHVWNQTKQIRFFADDYYDMNDISKYLDDELKHRKETSKEDKNKYEGFNPYYLIITDNYQQLEKLKFITSFLKTKENFGFSLLCITDDLFKLPNECKLFVEIEQNKGIIYENKNYIESQREITLDREYEIPFELINYKLSNIPIRITGNENTSLLPNRYSFLEMFNVGKIEDLHISDRWKDNDSTVSLKTPIGIDSSGMLISLDIHEKFHGPHGLIAGSTGSGKSEFIITYMLSLAINYHPDDLTFLIIDYKGGGLAGAFEGNDFKLPHLVGTITNIDKNGLQRSLTSIQSELKRRQIIFNEARNLTNEGTIDIYKYQRLYHEGIVKEPIPHLLIICDEFAELKQQQEEFMDELISVSRIGRSLGVHLILATQKPAGVVNDQIRSNSKFAVCLKVQDTSDSVDVIKKPDAAYLKSAGQFYLQVGNDEYFVLGQSGWAGETYIPSDIIKKKIDTSVEFISNIGKTIKRMDDIVQQEKKNNKTEQLTSIVRYICDLSKEEQINKNNLWLENIPPDIYVDKLRNKYKVKKESKNIEAVIGEYDDPYNQKQGLVKINVTQKDNVEIFGNAESGKETLLSTMIYDLITNYTSEEVQFYILDFGSEALKIYKNSPHVGDVIFVNEEEKIQRFFEMIKKEMQERKNILSNYNGDYDLYLSKGNKMPTFVVILNNYEAFDENYELTYDEDFLALTRDCPKYGIIFIITISASNNIKYRLSQNFNRKIALQINNEDEYDLILNKANKKKPSHIFGRGLTTIDNDDVFEFQTARICDHKEYNMQIQETIDRLNKENKIKAMPVPVIPKVLRIQDVKEYLKDITQVPIGMVNTNFDIYTYDFRDNFTTLILSKNMNNAINFAYKILEEIKLLKDVNIVILDAEEIRKNKKTTLKKSFKEFEKEIEKNIKSRTKKLTLCLLIGINKFLSEEAIDEFELDELFKKANKSEIYSFILIDNINLLKNNEYQQWYQNYIKNDSGIWVGNGVTEQTNINNSLPAFGMKTDYNSSFGYIIKDEEATLIKLIGMEEKRD